MRNAKLNVLAKCSRSVGDGQIVGMDTVVWLTALGPRTLLREVDEGRFPCRRNDGTWTFNLVLKWLETRPMQQTNIMKGDILALFRDIKWVQDRIRKPRFRFLRMKQLIQITGLSKSQIPREIETGHFPRGYYLTPGTVGWRSDEIADFLEGRMPTGQRKAPDVEEMAAESDM